MKLKLDSSVIVILIIFIIITSAIAINVIFSNSDRITNAIDENGNIHALFILEDEETVLSIQLMIINANTKKTAFLDLPPYLGVVIDENNLDEIGTLYNSGYRDDFIAKIEDLTQRNIDLYLQVTVQQVANIVDLLEGVHIFLISGSAGNNTLPSGDALYDGSKAYEYIQFFRNEIDNTRQIDGFQAFFKRLFITIAEHNRYLTQPDILRYFYKAIDTNVSKNDIMRFLNQIFVGVREEQLSIWTTQGDLRSVVVNETRKLLLFPYLNGKWVEETVENIEVLVAESANQARKNARLQILNGTTITGLARRTKLLYEQFGYTVVNIGNYEEVNVAETVIINHTTDENLADAVATVINASNFSNAPASEVVNDIDLTIVIGSDFDGIRVK